MQAVGAAIPVAALAVQRVTVDDQGAAVAGAGLGMQGAVTGGMRMKTSLPGRASVTKVSGAISTRRWVWSPL
jgi:hypothetical protein